jgi:hypothetical protein
MLKLKYVRWIIPMLLLILIALTCFFVTAHPLGAHAAMATPNSVWGGH